MCIVEGGGRLVAREKEWQEGRRVGQKPDSRHKSPTRGRVTGWFGTSLTNHTEAAQATTHSPEENETVRKHY